MADVQRNFGSEAAAIASGESSILPQREHLVALAQHAEAAIAHSLKLTAVVVAIMVDNGIERLPMPGGLLKNVKDRRYGLNVRAVLKDDGVTPAPDGSLVLELVLPATPSVSKVRLN